MEVYGEIFEMPARLVTKSGDREKGSTYMCIDF